MVLHGAAGSRLFMALRRLLSILSKSMYGQRVHLCVAIMSNRSARSAMEAGEAIGDSKGMRRERALSMRRRVLAPGRRRLRVSSAVRVGIVVILSTR